MVPVRNVRYTYEFLEESDDFTLCFFDRGEEADRIFHICGTTSGRDTDKMAMTGLRPIRCEGGVVYYEQAKLVLVCHKIYSDFFREECFADPAFASDRTYHKVYMGQIMDVIVRD